MPENPPIIAGTRIGHVHLKVADLDRALGFYCGVLGFEVMQRMGSAAAFISAGGYHHHIGLNTWESKGGHPPPPGTTGLFHTAILYPTAPALADALHRVIAGRHPARRRQRPRRQRSALPARPRPERRRTLLGPARRSNGRARRTARWRCSRSGSIWTICCGSGRPEPVARMSAATSGPTHAGSRISLRSHPGYDARAARIMISTAAISSSRCSHRTAARNCPRHRAAGRSRRGRTRR